MAPYIIIGVCLTVAVFVSLYMFLKDHLPARRKAVENAWNFEPYKCAIRHGYDIHIDGEGDAMAAPPDNQPEGYLIQVDHEKRTLWLIPVK